MPDAPGEHRLRQDVVEDLEPAAVVPAHDAVFRQRPEDRRDIGLGDTGVLGEVGGLLSDLGSGRRHEVVEQPRGDVLLGRLQRCEGALEVVGDDPAAAPRAGRGSRRGARAAPAPTSISHSRCITSWRNGASIRADPLPDAGSGSAPARR